MTLDLASLSGDDWARLIYLGILALAVFGSLSLLFRRGGGRALSMLAVWGLIFLGVIAAHGLWSDIGRQVMPRQAVFGAGSRIEVPKAADGHYYLTLALNGTAVRFVIDTGASDMVLSAADARRVGIDPERLSYIGQAQTANGRVRTAPVKIDRVVLGGVEDRNVRATVTDGQMDGSLLGMSYLSRFASIEISGGRMVLNR